MRLSRDAVAADDLVQETVLRAIQSHQSFRLGTNLGAWLMTILRNCFLTNIRRDRRGRMVLQQLPPTQDTIAGEQEHLIRLREVAAAIANLPEGQRRSLVMIGLEDASYAEAADRCGCSVGTIKSRVSRARKRLATNERVDPMPEAELRLVE
jgi:RNA polymerase sigma-70 factor, ECF subfamily